MPKLDCDFRHEFFEYASFDAIELPYSAYVNGVVSGLYIANTRMRYLLAIHEEAGECYGLAAYLPNEEAGVSELKDFFVEEGMRGNGIGTELLECFEESSGSLRKQLKVVPNNSRARALYERHGYSVIEHRGSGIVMEKA